LRVPARLALLGPLRERPFALLFLGRTISLLGSAIAPVALAFAVIEISGSPSDLGIVLAATFVPQIFFLLIGGVWSDRLPRHIVMAASDLVGAAAQAAVAALLIVGAAEVWHIAVLAAVRGIAAAFFVPASTGVVPQVVGPNQLQQANALLAISRNGTAVGGAALAGILVAALGPGWALAADAATYALGAVFVAMLKLPPAERARRHFLRELADGWNEVRSRRWLWSIVTQFTFINAFAWAAFFVLGPFVAEESLGGPAAWGLVLTAQAGGMLAGGAVALRMRPRRPLFVGNLAILLITVPLAALALQLPVVAIALAAFIAGAGVEFFEVLWATTLQHHIPEARLSRVSSYDWLGSFMLVPLGTMAIGPLAAILGTGDTLWLAAGTVVTVTLTVVALGDIRRVTGAAPTEDRSIVVEQPFDELEVGRVGHLEQARVA
jgi:predicted MFS family arabinose efflux permease